METNVAPPATTLPQLAPVGPFALWAERLAYGSATIVTLWMLGGGHTESFGPRLLIGAPLLLAIAVLSVIAAKLGPALRLELAGYKRALPTGVAAGIATALPVVVLIVVVARAGLTLEANHPLTNAVEALKSVTWIQAAIGTIILMPAWSLISRALLQSNWGLGGIAFLDAITIGFGLQLFVPFLIAWAMGAIWGWSTRRFGWASALISQIVWGFLVFGALAAV